MLISEAHRRLKQYCIEVIGSMPFPVHVIETNQISSRTQKPFVTINIDQIKTVSMPIDIHASKVDVKKSYLEKELVVTFAAYSDMLHQPEDILSHIQNCLVTNIANNIFRGEIVYRNKSCGIAPIPTYGTETTECGATLEIEMSLMQEVLESL